MKSFLKKRWHHLPVSIITAILLVCLLAGGALAYTAWTGTADVTVDEALTVSASTLCPGTWDAKANTWTVSMYPGESASLIFRVNNLSAATLTVTPGVTPDFSSRGITTTWDPTSVNMPHGGPQEFTLTVAASTTATPDTYDYTISFDRE